MISKHTINFKVRVDFGGMFDLRNIIEELSIIILFPSASLA